MTPTNPDQHGTPPSNEAPNPLTPNRNTALNHERSRLQDRGLSETLASDLDRHLDALLAVPPTYAIPADFAQRTAAKAAQTSSGASAQSRTAIPRRRPFATTGDPSDMTPREPVSLGLRLTMASLVLLLLALLVTAADAPALSRATLLTTDLTLSAELLLSAIGLSWWRTSAP